jgi:hypothetical protein
VFPGPLRRRLCGYLSASIEWVAGLNPADDYVAPEFFNHEAPDSPGSEDLEKARTAVSAGDPEAGDPSRGSSTSLCCYVPVLSVTVYP